MPFEIAESHKAPVDLMASAGPRLEDLFKDNSMLFVDNHVLFDGIS